MRLSVNQFRDIVRRQFINELDRVFALDVDFAHMRNVEKSRMAACRQVFGNHARRVLHRHMPAAEINHFAAQFTMRVVERRFLQI